MKQIIFFLFIAAILVGCSSQPKHVEQAFIYVNNQSYEKEFKNNKLTLEGLEIKSPVVWVSVPRLRMRTDLIVEKGATVTIDKNGMLQVGGSPLNEELSKMKKLLSKAFHGEDVSDEVKEILQNNNTNYVGLLALELVSSKLSNDEIIHFLKGLQEYENQPKYRDLALGSGMKTMPMIPIEQMTPEGEMLSLSSIKAKVIMVDFWASWCKPCRMEHPDLIAMYEKYHDKGLEILGVSLDDNKEAWLKAIEQDKLPWLQVSNLDGWNGEVARAYEISSIPHTVIINEEGRIVSRGLRGKALEEKIASLLE